MAYSDEVLADSPVNYYRLGESSGNLADLGSAGKTLTSLSNLTYAQAGGISGDANTSILFTAASSSFAGSTSSASMVDGDTFTVEAWINPVSLISGGGIYNRGTGGISMLILATGGIRLDRHISGVVTTSTTTVSTGVWSHVAWTKATTTSVLYINGVDRTGTVVNQTVASNQGVGIGCRGTNPTTSITAGTYFDGYIDEVAVYSTALSAARILAHYQAGAPPSGSAADNVPHIVRGRGAA